MISSYITTSSVPGQPKPPGGSSNNPIDLSAPPIQNRSREFRNDLRAIVTKQLKRRYLEFDAQASYTAPPENRLAAPSPDLHDIMDDEGEEITDSDTGSEGQDQSPR